MKTTTRKSINKYLFPSFFIGSLVSTYLNFYIPFVAVFSVLLFFYTLTAKKIPSYVKNIKNWIPFLFYTGIITAIGFVSDFTNSNAILLYLFKFIVLPIIVFYSIPKDNNSTKESIIILRNFFIISIVYGLVESIIKYNVLAEIVTIEPWRDILHSMNQLQNYQSSSLFLHYNYYGIILAYTLITLFYFPIKAKLLNNLSILIIIEQLLFTQSRIAWISAFIIIFIHYLKSESKKRTKEKIINVILVVALASIALMVLNGSKYDIIGNRFESIFAHGLTDGSLGQRLGTFLNFGTYFVKNSLLGIFGAGFLSIGNIFMGTYSYFEGYSTADCQYVIFLVEFGIIGTILFFLSLLNDFKKIIGNKDEFSGFKKMCIVLFIIEFITLDLISNNIILLLIYFALFQKDERKTAKDE